MSKPAITESVCRLCARPMVFPNDTSRVECVACGTLNTHPRPDLITLKDEPKPDAPDPRLMKAHSYRTSCSFTSAEKLYSDFISASPDSIHVHEAHWGRLMCRYGVEQVLDPKTQQYMPTCHFTHMAPMRVDPDYLEAMRTAPEDMKGQYLHVAEYVDQVQTKIRSLYETLADFDIFLCYKQSDPESPTQNTRDYHRATQLYYTLRDEGYNVFFADQTLKSHVGANYEAMIFHGLRSARAMLLFCSDASYLETAWVRSEWTRFLEFADKDQRKQLIPLLYEMRPEELPRDIAYRNIQGLKMDEYGVNNLSSRLSAMFPARVISVDAELASAREALSLGDWTRASSQLAIVRKKITIDKQGEQFSDYNLYSLLWNLHLRTPEALKGCTRPFTDTEEWQLAWQHGTDAQRARLSEYQAAQLTDLEPFITKAEFQLFARNWPAVTTQLVTIRQKIKPEQQRKEFSHYNFLRLLLKYHARNQDELAETGKAFTETEEWKLALEYADEMQQARYQDVLAALLYDPAEAFGKAESAIASRQWDNALAILEDAGSRLRPAKQRREYSHLNYLTLLARSKAADSKELADANPDFPHTPEWQRAIEYAAPDQLNEYRSCEKAAASNLSRPLAAARTALLGGDWATARLYLDEVEKQIDTRTQRSEYSDCSLFKLLLNLRLKRPEDLPGSGKDFTAADEWRLALEYADPQQHKALTDLSSRRDDEVVTRALEAVRQALAQHDWLTARQQLSIVESNINTQLQREAYAEYNVYKLLHKYQLSHGSNLAKCGQPVVDTDEWRLAMSYASAEQKQRFNSWLISLPDTLASLGLRAEFNADETEATLEAYCCTGDLPETLTLPEGVVRIQSEAFHGCDGLKTLRLPRSLRSIDANAVDCSLPGLVVEVHDDLPLTENPFSNPRPGCIRLLPTEAPCLYIQEDMLLRRTEGKNAILIASFARKAKLAVPEGVTKIASYAFAGSNPQSPTNITLPAGVTAIEHNAFSGNARLKVIRLSDKLTTIGGSAFAGCTGLLGIDIPGTVTEIGGAAFSGCSAMTSAHLPAHLTTLGHSVFNGCSSLTAIDIPDRVTVIGDSAFRSCASLNRVRLPKKLVSLGRMAFSGCAALKEITIPKGVTKIDESTFFGCSSLTRATISGPVATVARNAFAGCIALRSLTFRPGLLEIADGALQDCRALDTLALPASLHTITNEAVRGCNPKLSIRAPRNSAAAKWAAATNRVKASNWRTPSDIFVHLLLAPFRLALTALLLAALLAGFCFLTKNAAPAAAVLEHVHVPSDNAAAILRPLFDYLDSQADPALDDEEIYSRAALRNRRMSLDQYEYEIVDGVCTITGVKAGAELDRTLVIPSGVHAIADNAFYGNDDLESVKLPSTLVYVGRNAFAYCSELEEVTFTNANRDAVIDDYAFAYCESLNNVSMRGSGVTEIGHAAFAGCMNLEELVLPEKLETLGAAALSNCTELESVALSGSVQTIGSNAFTKRHFTDSVVLLANGNEEVIEYAEKHQIACRPNTGEEITDYAEPSASDYFAAAVFGVAALVILRRLLTFIFRRKK